METDEILETGYAVVGEEEPASLREDGAAVPSVVHEMVDIEAAVSSEPPAEGTAVSIWLYRQSVPPVPVALADVPALIREDENFVWIDVAGYREADLEVVAEALGIEERAVTVALAGWQRPRIEVFSGYFLASATVARLDTDSKRVHAGELDLVVGANYLLSTHKLPLPFAGRLRTRAAQDPELVRLDSAFMLYLVLDELLDYYDELQELLTAEIEEMQYEAIRNPPEDFLAHLLEFKRYVFALAQLAKQHRPVFQAFLRPDFLFVAGDRVSRHFEALDARLDRVVDGLMAAREEVTGAFDMYVSHETHRTNRIIRLLTMVSAGLLPITVILGFFGTTFRGLGGLYSPTAFVVMWLLILLTVAGVLIAFHRQGWL